MQIRLWCRRAVIQGAVWPERVVFQSPFFNQHLCFSQCIEDLSVEAGIHFISIDPHVLLKTSRYEKDREVLRFAKVAEALGGPDAEILSHIRVAAGFFCEIWKDGDPPLRNKAQTGKILECIMRGRHKLAKNIVERFQLSVLSRNNSFQKYLIEWLKGHFFFPYSK
jgi:hypothetical protein